MKYLISLIKKIVIAKFVFFNPTKKDIVIFDKNTSWIFKKILKKKYFILDTRLEQINFFVIFKMLLSFKFNKLSYLLLYIKQINPKIIFTFTDNDINFYKLKNFLPNIKFISIQNGLRTKNRSFFSIIKKNKLTKKDLKTDLILTFNEEIGKYFKKYIDCSINIFGSLKNNLVEKSNQNYSYRNEILFISQFRDGLSNNKNIFFNTENILLPIISFFCKKLKKKLYILSAQDDYNKEFNFYSNILNKNDFKLIKKKIFPNNYKILDSFKLIVGIDSTMIYEALARGKRIVVLSSRRIENLNNNIEPFGWPYRFNKEGIFFSSKLNENKIINMLHSVYFMKNNTWKRIVNNYKKLMEIKSKNYSVRLIHNLTRQ